MAKKSKQRSTRQQKDQSGCMWGIISMFDFRHGRTTRRLLSDRRRYTANNTTHGSSYPTSEANLPTSSQETHLSIEDAKKTKKPSFDLMRTRVKELIADEMFIDQDPKSIRKDHHEQMNISKTLKRSFDEELSISHQVSAQKTSQYHDLEALVKEILLIYQKKNEQHGDLDTGPKRPFPIVEEKIFAAVEVLLNETSKNGDHKKIPHSKEMFQMLSSNKEMFLKLLQDQNSILLKENQNSKSKSKSIVSSNLLETMSTDQGPEEPVTRKHRKYFRRRSKSQENISLNQKDRIVILKPGSSENQTPVVNEIHSSQFSFMEIKRRLKNAMGKEQRTPGAGPTKRTGKTVLDGGWSSPNRDHFYTERFARVTSNGIKMGDRFSKLRESETETETENENANANANNRMSNIYVEAKKHLSEMLTSGDEDAESMMRSLPKSLGRILSLREYNTLSPGISPRAQLRPVVNKSQPITTIDNPAEKAVVPDGITSEGVQEITKSPSYDIEHKEQTEGCEPRDSPNEDRPSESLELDLQVKNELPTLQTPNEPSLASKTEEQDISPGKPSPVSVLEPVFSDDDISPARTVSRPMEAAVQPLCIQFDRAISHAEDQQIRITDSGDSEESAFEYVEAVLLSSDLNWLEFEKRWISSVQILDPSLFDEVETFSGRAKYDQRLLFDSTNVALEEVCDLFIPESSFIKRNVWPVPKGMDLINEVWSRLELCLCKPYPRDLSKLVRNELETSKRWLDVRPEYREMVKEIQESIIQETIDDTLSSLLNDCADGEILDDRTNNALSCS